MIKISTLLFTAVMLFSTPLSASDWTGGPNVGAQGVSGANVYSWQGEDFESYNLNFGCSSKAGRNHIITLDVTTPFTSFLEPGNEDTFPMYFIYEFSDGTRKRQNFMLAFMSTENDWRNWTSTFELTNEFLRNFAGAHHLTLMSYTEELVYRFSLNGSAKASQALVTYCASGDYSDG